jgi:hypothetical protein
MKNTRPASAHMTTLICAALTCAAMAQSVATPSTDPSPAQTAAANPSAQSPKLAAGTVIPVELTKTVDAKKAKTGDEVVARVSQYLKASSGEILVSKDTKVIGHVTEVQARTKEQKESELGIAFDHAVGKSGEMNLPMSIQAIIAPVGNASSDSAGGYGRSGPATGGATATSPMGSRNGPMEGPPAQPSPSAIPTAGTAGSTNTQRPPITNTTQGVIGIPDLKLAAGAQNAPQGSVVSSEKSNVKLESGTIMLLRVTQ